MNSDLVETTQCTNCKHDILSSNFVIHTIHCQRNIYLCSKCNEPVNRNQKEDHDKTNHTAIFCTSCHSQVERCELPDHLTNHCPNRKVKCQICDIDVGAADIAEHENYCGARTEKCSECGLFVMLKYKQLHLESNHTFIKLFDESGPSPSWQNGRRTLGNFLSDISSGSPKAQINFKKKPSLIGKHSSLDDTSSDIQNSRVNFVGAAKKTAVPKIHANISSSNKEIHQKSEKLSNKPAPPEGTEDVLELDRLLALQIEHLSILEKSTEKKEKEPLPSEEDDLMYAIRLETELNQEKAKKNDLIIVGSPRGLLGSTENSFYKTTTDAFRDAIEKQDPDLDDILKNVYLPKSKTVSKVKVPDYYDDSDDEYLLYSKERTTRKPVHDISLPCEFCGTMVPSEDLILHQTGCSLNFNDHPKEPISQHQTAPTFNEDVVEIPCQFCDVLFPITRLESHQSNCDKRSSYKQEQPRPNFNKTPNRLTNMKSMSDKYQTGLQNGVEPSSPRLSGLGTRSELLYGTDRENMRHLPEGDAGTGAVPRTRQRRKSRRAPLPPKM